MASTSIIYNLIARDNASRTMDKVGNSAGRLEKGLGRLGSALKTAAVGIGAADLIGAAAVKMAADFQTQMTRVRTGAGELQKNMATVSSGILKMAGEVGQSTSQLTTGLYTVESAGFHGAAGLNVLKTAAMGAKVGAADLGTVTDAVTTALNAYKLGAGSATKVTNALIATEAEGKTNMEALAGSLSSILPAAAAAHVGLTEVLGAMATMTAQGTPAKVAATYLRQTIGQLSNPSAKAADEMKSLGLSATKVGLELGSKGLAATLTTLTTAIERHMGPAGTVLINQLQSASKNTSDYQKVLANLSPTQQTYIGALATMVGGTKSMMAALQLTGSHMKTFQSDTAGIAEHVKKGGTAIEGWADVQKTFNQRLAQAKDGLQAVAIKVGTAALPALSKLVGGLSTSVIPAVGKFAGFLVNTAVPSVAHFGSTLANKFVPIDAIKRDLSTAASQVGDFMQGLSGHVQHVMFVPHHGEIELPESSGAQLGEQVRGLFSGGLTNGLKAINWGDVGKTLAAGFGRALAAVASTGKTLVSVITKVVGGIDWLNLGKTVGVTAVPFAIGFVNSLLTPLFTASFWAKHWSDVLLFAVSIIPIGKLAGPLAKVMEKIPFLKVFAPLLRGVETLTKPLVGAFDKVWDFVGSKFMEGFTEIFPEAEGAISKFVGKVTYAIWSKAVDIADAAGKMIGGMASGIGRATGAAVKAVGTFVGKILSPFAKAGSWLLGKGADLVSGLKNGIVTGARGVGGWLGDHVVTPVKGAFGKAGSWLVSSGKDLLAGLKSGIVGAMKGIGSWVKSNIVDPVVKAVKHFFGIHSPSTVFAELGGHLTAGLLKGMAGTGGTAIARLVFGDLPHALEHIVGKGLVSLGSLPGKALSALGGLGSSVLSFLGLGGGGSSGGAQKLGETMAAAYGWSGAQWAALRSLWQGESGWNPRALNASSGAYGIPQALPASKMAAAGSDWKSNPATQIKWGLSYIHQRYGTPAAAYSAWLSRSPHWYAAGTPSAAPGWAVVGERGPELVNFRGGERVVSNSQSRQALAAPQVTLNPTFNVRVFIGDQELTDLVRIEVEHGHEQLATALDAGHGWGG